ncbi:MAG: tRNA (N6-threonylcarbamoyladenosine(37)-N6)-methyltransferase TrmO [Akkermansiaceae bacterium]
MSEVIEMRPIGRVESCFQEKFGTPRQSGLVPEARGRIVFSEDIPPEACRGLGEFSHVWLVFLFNQVGEDETRWLVRPPRLGGNEKMGVYATRSPFRPNRIGLSLVALEKVADGFLEVGGLDVVDGTTVLDVKPYLPYVEALPDASGGFAGKAPTRKPVDFADEVRDLLDERQRDLITGVLAVDPRPAYHQDERTYGCRIAGLEVNWQVIDGRVLVLSCRRVMK